MVKKKLEISSDKLKDVIVKGIQEKKGEKICVLDLRKVKNAVADFFVICQANSDTQVKAIGDSIRHEALKNLNEKPFSTEGVQNAEWVLIDYVNVVAHIFLRDIRDFYALEELWGDAVIETIESTY